MKAVGSVNASRHQWGERIAARWKDSVEAVIAVGKLLLAAKADLPHGDFEAMVRDDLPFKERTAERLMAIASNNILANPAHVSLLPASWATLYQLSRLPEELLARALSEGAIHPELGRKEVARLLGAKGARARWDLDEALGRLVSAVDSLVERWPPGEQAREVLARRLIVLGEQLLKADLGSRRPARAAARRVQREIEAEGERPLEIAERTGVGTEAVLAVQAESERLKDKLTNLIVDELKDPVNGIAMLAQLLLRKGALSGMQRKNVVQIEQTCRDLLRLVEDVREITKIEAGQKPVTTEHVVLAELVDEVAAEYGPIGKEVGRRLHIALGTDLPTVVADRALLRRVLANLAVNTLRRSGNTDVRIDTARSQSN